MIKEMQSLSLAEAKHLVETNKGKEDLEPYFNKFIKLKLKDAEGLRKELESLNSHKIKKEHISLIIDFLPEDASDLNKIFTDISLDENEIKQITALVAKYK